MDKMAVLFFILVVNRVYQHIYRIILTKFSPLEEYS